MILRVVEAVLFPIAAGHDSIASASSRNMIENSSSAVLAATEDCQEQAEAKNHGSHDQLSGS